MEDIRYKEALAKVRKIRSFYTHLIVYVMINLLLIIGNRQWAEPGVPFWSFSTFSTAFFWGIGLAAHGLSVFGPDWFLGKKWEERKIRELMEKEKNRWE